MPCSVVDPLQLQVIEYKAVKSVSPVHIQVASKSIAYVYHENIAQITKSHTCNSKLNLLCVCTCMVTEMLNT